mmetsp:Transcript_9181/g.16307  ORF Transcript_9181/g.16307 Transcript_9181/m.16307 type:complete len:159 (+) Transcript_9181:1362-1838(+)
MCFLILYPLPLHKKKGEFLACMVRHSAWRRHGSTVLCVRTSNKTKADAHQKVEWTCDASSTGLHSLSQRDNDGDWTRQAKSVIENAARPLSCTQSDQENHCAAVAVPMACPCEGDPGRSGPQLIINVSGPWCTFTMALCTASPHLLRQGTHKWMPHLL